MKGRSSLTLAPLSPGECAEALRPQAAQRTSILRGGTGHWPASLPSVTEQIQERQAPEASSRAGTPGWGMSPHHLGMYFPLVPRNGSLGTQPRASPELHWAGTQDATPSETVVL